jgi:hypothetical protein
MLIITLPTQNGMEQSLVMYAEKQRECPESSWIQLQSHVKLAVEALHLRKAISEACKK